MAGIKIKWLSDEADAVSGAKKVSASLDDVATDMEKLVDAGHDLNKSNADIARDLSKIDGRPFKEVKQEVDKAERSSKDLSSELDDTRRSLDKVGDAARNAGDDGSAGLGKIKKGAQEVQQEVGQNLGEAVSSIRGDFSDLGQVGQDTLGGLAATVAGAGPAGLVGALALAAGAVGLGAVTAGMEEAKKKQEELNQAAADWASAYEQSAGRIVSSAFIVGDILDQSTDPERYKTATDAAKEWGVETPLAMRALAGDATALAVVQESLADRVAEANANMSEAERNVGKLGDGYSSLPADIQAGQDRLDALNGSMAAGAEQAQNAASALYDYAETVGVASGKTDDLGNKIVTLPDGKEIVVDALTQTAYENLDAIEQKKLADKNVNVNVNAVDYATGQMNGIIARLSGRSVTVGVGTVLKPNFGG